MRLALANLSRYPAPARIGVFLLILALVWLPIALPIGWLIKDSNTTSIVTIPILYGEFLLLVRVWGRWVHHQPNLLWRYGLEFSRRLGLELLSGLAIGSISLFTLFATQGALGWVVWQPLPSELGRVALEGLIVALGFGFAEELLFRGWLLDELQRDYPPGVALWADATVFALVHGLKLQFPALLLLGVTLIWAKRSRFQWEHTLRRERLGLPMGLHAGLIWGYYIVNVGQLVQYAHRVPEWVTGIDRNPLAGMMGLLFMSLLAIGLWQFARTQRMSGPRFVEK